MTTYVSVLREALSAVDRKWPAVKYFSLGLYSAWILLVMGSSAIVHVPAYGTVGQIHNMLYMLSGVPLALSLILCGVASKTLHAHIVKGPLVPLMSLLASVCTFGLVMGWGAAFDGYMFLVLSCGTGIGTSFLCVRVGAQYATLTSPRIFFTVFFSAVLANFMYFMCAAINYILSCVVVSLLPLGAMAFCMLGRENRQQERIDADVIPIEMLPRGYFKRTLAMVLIFTTAVGIIQGLASLEVADALRHEEAVTSVFISFAVKVLSLAVVAVYAGAKRFDVSRIYYPIAVVACLAIMLSPLLGDDMRIAQLLVVDVSYNIFILAIWCILSSIAAETSLSSTRVFGLGRGASGLGTTLGQFLAMIFVSIAPTFHEYAIVVAVCLAAVVLFAVQFVMGRTTISAALESTFPADETVFGAFAEEGQQASEEAPAATWRDLCTLVAAEKSLTAREAEILVYVSRGRTATFISEDLCISYNTAKGHIRNLYSKCGVHSRQELIDLVESKRPQ